jgi:acyl carrier protein
MNIDNGLNEENIIELISKFIKENFLLGEESKDLDINVSLYETRIVDSTGVLEIVDFLEEKFGIKIEDDELVPDNLDSIKKMSGFVKRKIENAS